MTKLSSVAVLISLAANCFALPAEQAAARRVLVGPPVAGSWPVDSAFAHARVLMGGRVRLIQTSSAGEARGLAARLRSTGRYEYVVLDEVVRPANRPNDPNLVFQWHHTRIESERAWDVRTGSSSVIIAICDTGISKTHADLSGRLVSGYNSADDNAEVDGGVTTDVEGHGTHVAGCAAAIGNNSKGLAGVCWNAKLMPIRITNDAGGLAALSDVIAGAQWAVDHGAKVVNASYTGIENVAVRDCGTYVRSKGGILIWAAGNDGATMNASNWPDVVIVGATDKNDQIASFSRRGEAVDLYAPGTDVWSTVRSGGYQGWDGTSESAGLTSGVAGLMLAVNPDLTSDQLERNLEQGCEPLANHLGRDVLYGWGRLNAYRAAKRVVQYRVEEIGTLAGFTNSEPTIMNDAGTIAGFSYQTNDKGHPFAWIKKNGVITQLPLANGYTNSQVLWLNANDEVVGFFVKSTSPTGRAAHWKNGVATALDTPASTFSLASGINDAGLIVGYGASGPNAYAAYWNTPTSPWAVYPNGGYPGGAGSNKVNNAGVMVGNVFLNTSKSLYSPAVWANKNAQPNVYTTTTPGYLTAVNEAGQAAGPIQNPTGGYDVITWSGSQWRKYTNAEINGQGKAYTFNIFGINSTQQMTGYIAGQIDTTHRAAVWNEYYPTDLNEMLQPAFKSIYFLPDSYYITLNGWLLVTGVKNNVAVACLLKPVLTQGQSGLTVNCGLHLEAYDGDPLLRPVNIDIVQNGDTVLSIPNVIPDENGKYQIRTFLRGTYEFHMQAAGFLKRTVTGVSITDTGSSAVNAVLLNGDIDNDNAVTVFDYSVLSDYFDRSTSDPLNDPAWITVGPNGFAPKDADLDGDGAITVFDYSVLSNNFDKSGD